MKMRIIHLAVCACLLVGCATYRCPAEGGPAWRELRSEHYVVSTNLETQAARDLVEQLEHLRQAVLLKLPPQADHPGTVEAIVFAEPAPLVHFGSRVDGYVAEGSSAPLIVLGTRTPLQIARTWHRPQDMAAMTIALDLVKHAYPGPKWLTVGLAEQLESVSISTDGKSATFGAPEGEAREFVLRNGALPLETLWEWKPVPTVKGMPGDVPLNYSSWAWVAYLSAQFPDRFAQLLSKLSSFEEPRAAWAATFPPEVLRDAEGGIARVLDSQPILSSAPISLRPAQIQERVMRDAEVHLLRARIWMTAGWPIDRDVRRDGYEGEIAEALRRDPSNVQAHWLEILAAPEGKKEGLARTLSEKHPENGEAWAMLIWKLGERKDSTPLGELLLAQAIHAEIHEPWAMNVVASAALKAGRVADAEALASRAVRVCPWQSEILDTYAAVLAARGRCAEAQMWQSRSISLIPPSATPKTREPYLARLASYQHGCPQTPPPSPPH